MYNTSVHWMLISIAVSSCSDWWNPRKGFDIRLKMTRATKYCTKLLERKYQRRRAEKALLLFYLKLNMQRCKDGHTEKCCRFLQ